MPELLDTRVRNRWIVQPNHTNSYDMLHGGTVVKWMDEVGVMAAMRFAGQPCVTAQLEQVSFEQPVPMGDIVLIEAYVYDTGDTSVDVRIQAEREHPLTGDRELMTESFFVYVALDDEQRPTSVPALTVRSEQGEQLRDAALEDRTAMNTKRTDRSD